MTGPRMFLIAWALFVIGFLVTWAAWVAPTVDHVIQSITRVLGG